METRIEQDALGERPVAKDAYYGIQTDRAIENFPISGLRPKPAYVEATVHIKKAAALVNSELGRLDSAKANAISQAADEILAGRLREWFVVDVYQAGAGTSHNMNVNEVMANRAIEILGGRKGDYHRVHPNDDVNMSQSSNDVCPAALRIAALIDAQTLLSSLEELEHAFAEKANQFDGVIKSGRTHLADAVPIRLGQEFGAWAANMRKHKQSLLQAANKCKELGIGGTAVGTGLNAHPKFSALMVQQLSRQIGIHFELAENLFEAMESIRPLVDVSGAVRALALDLIRISNDIRLLASGPKTGLYEITLPAVQPGSSIMPGKVNPVLAEMMDMVCFQIVGCDTAILMAAQAGQLELNVMLPVVAFNLLHEIEILTNAVTVYSRGCIQGITADVMRCRELAEASISNITALSPYIGYAVAAEIAKESIRTGKAIRTIALERKLIPPEKLEEILDLRRMTEPGLHE